MNEQLQNHENEPVPNFLPETEGFLDHLESEGESRGKAINLNPIGVDKATQELEKSMQQATASESKIEVKEISEEKKRELLSSWIKDTDIKIASGVDDPFSAVEELDQRM